MNDLAGYLGMHQEITELVLVLGTGSNAALVYDLCSVIKLDKLVLAVPAGKLEKEVQNILQRIAYEEKAYLPKRVEWRTDQGLYAYTAETEQMALLFDAPWNTEEVIAFCRLKPRYLAGISDRKKVNAFQIWEVYRKVSDGIYLLS